MDRETRLINLALDCGEIMLRSGAETFRVQDTMKRILSTTGRDKIEATAISTALLVTLPREDQPPLAMMRGVHMHAVDFQKICAVNTVSRAFVSGEMPLDEAAAQIRQISNRIAYPLPLRILSYGLISGCFSYLTSQSLPDGFLSFFVGLLLGLLLFWLGGKKVPYFLPSFLGGACAALCAGLAQRVLPAANMQNIIIGSIMPLLPGVSFCRAMRDLLEGNLISGNTKMVEALLTACFLAGGVGTVLHYFF